MLDAGWVRLHRKIEDSPVWFESPNVLKVWMFCLVRANWEARRWKKGQVISRGSFVTGREAGSTSCGMKPSTFRNCLDRLEELGNITKQTSEDRKWTVISVCNYETYNSQESDEGQTKDRRRTDEGQTKDIEEERKKERIEEGGVIIAHRFSEFWEAYPRRVGKQNAMRAWQQAVKRADPQQIIDAATRYASVGIDPQFIRYPATWLNGGCWDDDLGQVARGNGHGKPRVHMTIEEMLGE